MKVKDTKRGKESRLDSSDCTEFQIEVEIGYLSLI
jgi:hypothetical protein